MKYIQTMLVLCGVLILASYSCKEEVDTPCGCDSPTIQSLENVAGTVWSHDMDDDTVYYIDLQVPSSGLVRIKPCDELSEGFKKENLKVVVSGELKKMCPTGTPNTFVIDGHPFKINNIQISTQE